MRGWFVAVEAFWFNTTTGLIDQIGRPAGHRIDANLRRIRLADFDRRSHRPRVTDRYQTDRRADAFEPQFGVLKIRGLRDPFGLGILLPLTLSCVRKQARGQRRRTDVGIAADVPSARMSVGRGCSSLDETA